jgi:hypothetical protein
MLKKVFIAATACLVLAVAAVSVAPAPVQAGSGCYKAAKAKYATDSKTRHAYRKACKAHYKAYAGKKHHHWFKKAS